ncbi:peptidoglycan-binding domain-containing protein [Streptomyces sp. NPDC096205]|uniref:peptidoglycan-binding domain-containing protein n=1 Tax=Streptomyces sp. NPDC096205 TaxID=3366081 RepID=UPI00382B8526
MTDTQGHPCPECGALRGPDNTPSCGCALRAAEALLEARTAEAAAAEDFDPLRIRPYVDLDGTEAGAGPALTGPYGDTDAAGAGADPAQARPYGDHDATRAGTGPAQPRPYGEPDAAEGGTGPAQTGPYGDRGATRAGTGPAQPRPYGDTDRAGAEVGPAHPLSHTDAEADPAQPDNEPTQALPAVQAEAATAALPTPLAPPAVPPSEHDLRLFETVAVEPGPAGGGRGVSRRGRRGRTVLLAAGGAVVAVVAAAGLASGVFSYDTPSRDTALPSDVREAAPEVRTSEAADPAPATSRTAASPTTASPSPSASESASESPSESASPSPSESSASPTPTPSATASPTPTATTASAEPVESEDGGAVLRRGDSGREVAELQDRLRQLYLYNGEINGNFTPPVEDALRNYQWARGLQDESELGVYDQPTRAMLESETSEP